MNELSHHIICLLTENDCVILPGIGGFIAHYKPANYMQNSEEFVSPQRVIGFNHALTMNDGLIVQSYMIKFGVNYPDASKLVDKDIERLRQEINQKGSVRLEGLGMLVRHAGGSYNFEVSSPQIVTPELYGLSNISVETKRQSKGAYAVPAAPTVSETTNAYSDNKKKQTYSISIRRSAVHWAAAVAAAILISFLLSTPIGYISKRELRQTAMIGSLDFLKSTNTKKVYPNKDKSTKKAIAESEHTEEKATSAPRPYTIVLASAVSKKNAKYFIESLRKQGYNYAEIYKTQSMRRVIYGHFETEREALAALGKIKDKDFAVGAWIMKTAHNNR